MKVNTTRNGKEYAFELKDGVLTLNGKEIKCNVKNGFAIKINKKSVSADKGAEGVFEFVKKCISENFAMCYVWKIIEIFG